MQLIPAVPYRNGSNAEHRLFKQLKEAFFDEPLFIAFHSLNLTRHPTKRFSEIDFLVLCPYGVYVLEVKGGGVSYQHGNWHTLNRSGKRYTIQHPFKQAQSALHAIESRLREVSELSGIKLLTGYGVVFPDVEWKQVGAEWERPLICDSKKFRNCEQWLRQLFAYWKSKSTQQAPLISESQIQAIRQFLRPDFEQIEPLNSQLDHLKRQQVALTEEQYRYLDIAAANPRVLCSGGAGTGKTFLAVELARRLASQDCQVVFICKSNWLRRYLESCIANQNVTLSTPDSIVVDQRRAGIKQYDVLIVDEGQDLFSQQALGILNGLISGGMSDGAWYIFHDSNHQSGLLSQTHTQELNDVLGTLKSYSPAQLPLMINCRNSTPIIQCIEDMLKVRIGQQGTGDGPAVREYKTAANNATTLYQEIEALLNSGVNAGDITILSPLPYASSSASLLASLNGHDVIQLDDYSVRSLPVDTISFAEIKHFKGLESEVVIVIDLPYPDDRVIQQEKVTHYVGLTRARSLLLALWVGGVTLEI